MTPSFKREEYTCNLFFYTSLAKLLRENKSNDLSLIRGQNKNDLFLRELVNVV